MRIRYGLNIKVEGVTNTEVPKVYDVLREKWFLGLEENLGYYPPEGIQTVSKYAEGYLEEAESDFAVTFASAVWRVLERYAPVKIRLTNLEKVPYNEYRFSELTYKMITEKDNKQ